MNFLAHLYLSGDSDALKIGNFIGDFVKGRQYLQYDEGIQHGILLHRAIDSFTDQHQLVKQSSRRLREKFHKYSGIVIDVFYDHFLAANWPDYHPRSLLHYTRGCYVLMLRHYDILPPRVQQFLPFMISSNRLKSYARLRGIEKALRIMSHYTSLPPETDFAMHILTTHYSDFETEFRAFFDDMMHFAKNERQSTLCS